MKNDAVKIILSPEWNMLYEDGKLFVLKGSDEIYLIDDLDEVGAKKIYSEYLKGDLNSIINDEKYKNVVGKLRTAGFILPITQKIKLPIRISVVWVGEKNELLSEHFRNSKNNFVYTDSVPISDLCFVIRTSGALDDVSKRKGEYLSRPHILVDLAFSNTISIGPLVFQGETACLECFVGKIKRSWGDPIPPKQTAIQRNDSLIFAFILRYVEEFSKTGTCATLIEQAVSFNIKDMSIQHDKILRMPWCPVCFSSKPSENEGHSKDFFVQGF